jgi:DNA mismatch endonuclease (patch repair protein)
MSRWPGDAERERTTFGGLRRSQLMARVLSVGNKTTEERLASLLRCNGVRGWRRHLHLPGRPDFAWRKERVTVFVDGCFWHGHRCRRNANPKTNAAAWREKISRNQRRDRRTTKSLRKNGWTVIRIWECVLSKRSDQCLDKIRRALATRGHVNR